MKVMKRTIFVTSVVVLGAILCGMFEAVRPFGIPGETPMDDYFIIHALSDRSSMSVVSAMLYDFRGLDVLGEAAVIFTTLTAIGALFRDGGKRE